MLNIGDAVLYGSNGVCRVAEIKDELFEGETKKYYVLKPVFDEKNTFFVPSFNEYLMSKIRPVMTYDEADMLISKLSEVPSNWVDNDKTRLEIYKKILESGVREDVASVAKGIRERRSLLISKGKKLRSSDEMILKIAEMLIETECAFVLGVTREDICTRIFAVCGK